MKGIIKSRFLGILATAMLGVVVVAFLNGCAESSTDNQLNEGQRIIGNCWKNNSVHIDATECAFEQLQNFKNKLELIYNAKIIDARRSDKKMRAAGSEAFIYAEKYLANSQTNFMLYMESECEREVIYMLGGSYGGDVKTACKINFIIERIKLLNTLKL